MLFYDHTASFPMRLAVIAGISLGATILSILNPFGLSETNSTSNTWNRKVGQTQQVSESHPADHYGWCGMDMTLADSGSGLWLTFQGTVTFLPCGFAPLET